MNQLKSNSHILPLTSVIITTFSRPTNLLRAINSVLLQDYPNIEIIVVDDNGKNTPYQLETEELIRDYKKKSNFKYIIHSNNMNASVARNTGVKNSSGQYIALLDDDDEFLPSKISKQVRYLEENKSYGGAYCQTNLHIEKGKTISTQETKSGNLMEEVFLLKAQFNTSTLLLRKEIYEELNGFDESFFRHQDWEFMIRFFRKHKLLLIPEILLIRHREDGCFGPIGINALLFRLKYLRAFKNDIEALPTKNDIYFIHYHSLIVGMLLQREYRKTMCLIQRAKKYKSISIRNYLVYLKHFVLGILNF